VFVLNGSFKKLKGSVSDVFRSVGQATEFRQKSAESEQLPSVEIFISLGIELDKYSA
jgi:hypothetical protein